MMRSRRFRHLSGASAKKLVLAWIALGLVLGVSGQAESQYIFTTLDVPDSTQTFAYGINDSGQIVGRYDAGGTTHGFLYDGDSYTTLDVPGASLTFGHGINNSGRVVGRYDAGGTTHGFLYDGDIYTTRVVPGATFTSALGINSKAIRGSNTELDRLRAASSCAEVVRDEANEERSGSAHSKRHRDIVGRYMAGGIDHGFLLSEGRYTTLDVPGSLGSYAIRINDSGQIVGRYHAGGTDHGYVYDGESYTTLDPPGSTFTQAIGINASCHITGLYRDAGSITHGFLLSGGNYTTIDVPGATFATAHAINESGQIVGFYTDSQGTTHGYLATPVH